ncbi:MAG: UPF0147 family protein [Candidatus Norongarragalinales archaeon]
MFLLTDNAKYNEKVEQIVAFLDDLIRDNSVPRNVRATLAFARDKLTEQSEELVTRVSSAVYALDEVSNDINIPMHARTMVWNILSELEALKQQVISG